MTDAGRPAARDGVTEQCDAGALEVGPRSQVAGLVVPDGADKAGRPPKEAIPAAVLAEPPGHLAPTSGTDRLDLLAIWAPSTSVMPTAARPRGDDDVSSLDVRETVHEGVADADDVDRGAVPVGVRRVDH